MVQNNKNQYYTIQHHFNIELFQFLNYLHFKSLQIPPHSMELSAQNAFQVIFPKYVELLNDSPLHTDEDLQTFIREQLPQKIQLVRSIQPTFIAFQTQFTNLILKRPKQQNLIQSLVVKASQKIDKYFYGLEMINDKQVNKNSFSNQLSFLNLQQLRAHFRQKLKQFNPLLKQKYFDNYGIQRPVQQQIARRLYILNQLYYFIKNDLTTVAAKFKLKQCSILSSINKNSKNGQQNIQFSQLIYLDEKFIQNIHEVVGKRCRPFMGKKDFFYSKLKQIQSQSDSKVPININMMIQSILGKQKYRVTKQLTSNLSNTLRTIDQSVQQQMEKDCKQIISEVDSLKKQFNQLKNNVFYLDIIRGSFGQKYKMELNKLENIYYLSNIQKYLQDIQTFTQKLIRVQEKIIQNRKSFMKTLGDNIEEKIGDLIVEYQMKISSAGSTLRDVINSEFEALQKSLYGVITQDQPIKTTNTYNNQSLKQKKNEQAEQRRRQLQYERQKKQRIRRQQMQQKAQKQRIRREEQKARMQEKKRQDEQKMKKMKQERQQKQRIRRMEQQQKQRIRKIEMQQKMKEKRMKQEKDKQKLKQQMKKKQQQKRLKEADQAKNRQRLKAQKQAQQRRKKQQLQQKRKIMDEQKRRKQQQAKLQQQKIKSQKQQKQRQQRESRQRMLKQKKQQQQRQRLLKQQKQQRQKRQKQLKALRQKEQRQNKEKVERQKRQAEEKYKSKAQQQKREKQERQRKQRQLREKKQKQQKDKKQRQQKERRDKEQRQKLEKLEKQKKQRQQREKRQKQQIQRKKRQQTQRKQKEAKEKRQREQKQKRDRQQKQRKDRQEKQAREKEQKLKQEKQERQRKQRLQKQKKQKQAKEAQQKLQRQKKQKEQKAKQQQLQRQKKQKQQREKRELQALLQQQENAKKNKSKVSSDRNKGGSGINYNDFDDIIDDDLEELDQKQSKVSKNKPKNKNGDDDQYGDDYEDDFESPQKQEQQDENPSGMIEPKQLITAQSIKCLNDYMKGTSYSRKNKPNLEPFNHKDYYTYVFQELIQSKKMCIFESSVSNAILDFSKQLLDENADQQGLRMSIQTIKQEMLNEYQSKIGEQQFNGQTLLILPFSFQNQFDIKVIQFLPAHAWFRPVLGKQLLQDEQTQTKFNSILQGLLHIFQIQTDPMIQTFVLNKQSSMVLSTFDRQLPCLLTIFAMHYETQFKQDINITQYTVQRFFYTAHIFKPFYEAIQQNQQQLMKFYESTMQKYENNEQLSLIPLMIQTSNPQYETQLLQHSVQLKKQFLANKKLKTQLILYQILLQPEPSEMEEEQEIPIQKITIYGCMERDSTNKTSITYFIITKDQMQKENASTLFDIVSQGDDGFQVNVFMDFTRHNGLTQYSDWTLPLWARTIQKRKLTPTNAFRAITFAMSPYYIAFKQQD